MPTTPKKTVSETTHFFKPAAITIDKKIDHAKELDPRSPIASGRHDYPGIEEINKNNPKAPEVKSKDQQPVLKNSKS